MNSLYVFGVCTFAVWLASCSYGVSTTSKCSIVVSDLKSLESALAMYRLNAETMPSATSGLRALVERPHDLPADFKWVQIMSKIPIDPWGAEYRYVLGEDYPDGFGLYSRGPDGVSATLGNDEDDINSWSGPNKPGRMSGDEILVRSAGYGIMLAVGYFLGMASGSKRHTEA